MTQEELNIELGITKRYSYTKIPKVDNLLSYEQCKLIYGMGMLEDWTSEIRANTGLILKAYSIKPISVKNGSHTMERCDEGTAFGLDVVEVICNCEHAEISDFIPAFTARQAWMLFTNTKFVRTYYSSTGPDIIVKTPICSYIVPKNKYKCDVNEFIRGVVETVINKYKARLKG